MAKTDKTIVTVERCRTANTYMRVATIEYDYSAQEWKPVTHFDVKPGTRAEFRLKDGQAVSFEELAD